MLTILAACTSVLAAFGLVFPPALLIGQSWCGRSSSLSFIGRSGVGCILILISVACWSVSHGPEFGLTYALLAIPAAVWLMIWLRRDARPGKALPQASRWPMKPSLISIVSALRVPLGALLALASGAIFSVLIMKTLPVAEANRVTTVYLLAPVLAAVFWHWLTFRRL